MKTQSIGPFLGENNRLPDFALHVNKVGDFLRSTMNVDIDNKGNIRRRSATALILGTPAASHSIYMTTATTGYLVIGTWLYEITLPSYSQTPFKMLSNSDPLSWVASGDDLYYSNGTDSGRITAGVWYPLGIATPALPTLSLTTGTLLAGWYQVGVSYSNSATGEESGISASSNINLPATGGIHVPLPTMATGADRINIYLSAANGSVVYLLATVGTGPTTYDCTTLATGRESNGRFEDPLPAGTLFMSNGRLCSFKGNTVYVGSTWRHGYHLPAESYISFTAPVSIAIENQGGTYIVADKVRWFPGSDLGNVEAMVLDVAPHGAIPGTAFTFPDRTSVGWFGTLGVMFGDTQGQVVEVMNDNIDLTAPAAGCSAVLQSKGYMRVVSCGWCVNMESKAATQYIGWDFTSASGGYGTKADGIYLLDTIGLVPWSVGLGKQDFGTETFKHLPAVYLGVNAEEPLTLRVQAPNDVDYSYDARSAGTDMQIQRIDPGKGLRANWFDLTLSSDTGVDFTLASVSFAATASNRRI